MYWINKNIKIILNYVVGPFLFCLLLFSIYRQITAQPGWRQSLTQLATVFNARALLTFIAVLLLMLVNWGIEAGKWQLVIRRIQPISWIQAFKATLTGTTLAFFTPNRMGEYFGRILYIRHENRMKAISLTIVGSMAQILVTFFFGAAGLLVIRARFVEVMTGSNAALLWLDTFFYGAVAAFVLLTLFYFRFSWIVRWIEKIPRTGRFMALLNVLDDFRAGVLGRLLFLSVIRYGVFVLQYSLLFALFNVPLNPWQAFWSLSVVFLVMAIIPTIALFTELGVRWKTSIEIIQLFSANIVGILATSLAIWIINLVVPALMGSLLILNIRLFRYRAERSRQQPASGE